MKFTAAELAEIRSAFRQRIKTETKRRQPSHHRKPKLDSLPALVLKPDCEDDAVLRPAEVAELFPVTPRTVQRWADAGLLPCFRTVGGQRRFRWGEIRYAGY